MKFVYDDGASGPIAAELSTDSNELKVVFDDVAFAGQESMENIVIAFSVDDNNRGLVTINQGKVEKSMKMEAFLKQFLGQKPEMPELKKDEEMSLDSEVIQPGTPVDPMQPQVDIPPDLIPGPSMTLNEFKTVLSSRGLDVLTWADKYGTDIYKMYPNLQVFAELYRG